MNRTKLFVSFITVVSSSYLCFGQTTRGGIYFSPELNLPLQNPNASIVESTTPQVGFTTGGVIEFEAKENWTVRVGMGFTKSRYYTNQNITFQNNIEPPFGVQTHTKYRFNSIDVPVLVVYRKPESIIGGFAGVDLTAFSNQNVEYKYTNGSKYDKMTFVSINPSVNIGLQCRFRMGSGPSLLMVEPYSRYYLRSTGLSLNNLLSTGLRLVYLRPL